jgi:hypothetical protein
MYREELKKLLRERPFRPFRVFTTDGTAIPIWHPDFAYLSPDGRTLFVYQQNFDFDMLDVGLIPRFALDRLPEAAESDNSAGPSSNSK